MTIKASDKLSDLTGVGTEFFVTADGEHIRLEFFNGNIVRARPSGNTDETLLPENLE